MSETHRRADHVGEPVPLSCGRDTGGGGITVHTVARVTNKEEGGLSDGPRTRVKAPLRDHGGPRRRGAPRPEREIMIAAIDARKSTPETGINDEDTSVPRQRAHVPATATKPTP
jgi:hypothetical protein